MGLTVSLIACQTARSSSVATGTARLRALGAALLEPVFFFDATEPAGSRLQRAEVGCAVAPLAAWVLVAIAARLRRYRWPMTAVLQGPPLAH